MIACNKCNGYIRELGEMPFDNECNCNIRRNEMVIEIDEIRIAQSEITQNSYWVIKLDGEGTEIKKKIMILRRINYE